MVVASINGSGGPNFLTDVARPPGDGIFSRLFQSINYEMQYLSP